MAQIVFLLDERIANVLNVDTAAPNTERGSSLDFEDGCDLAVLFIARDGSVIVSSGNMHIFLCNGREVRKWKGKKLHVGEGRIKGQDAVDSIRIPARDENKFYCF